MGAHDIEQGVDRLELQHHVDREALVAQLRALSAAVEQLARAVEVLGSPDGGDDEAAAEVAELVDRARWSLRSVW